MTRAMAKASFMVGRRLVRGVWPCVWIQWSHGWRAHWDTFLYSPVVGRAGHGIHLWDCIVYLGISSVEKVNTLISQASFRPQ